MSDERDGWRDLRPGPNGLMAVITTVQEPTPSVEGLCRALAGTPLVAIGDAKGPRSFDVPGARLVSLTEQKRLPFELARRLPEGHYSRKNLGYLIAFGCGATHVYETDDDNLPTASWGDRRADVDAVAAPAGTGWLNVYASFSRDLVWPRGFPLDLVRSAATRWDADGTARQRVFAPIQQGLANGSPDVDAVWRLVLDAPFEFVDGPSILLPRGAWCPFNSQSTWWWPPAYPLMYLPSHCSFRMTDIWRGFVAQRCLWELGHGVVFHGAEVCQERNPHGLLRDFAEEVSGYLYNHEIAEALARLELAPGPDAMGGNLLLCYRLLANRGWVAAAELDIVQAWLEDVPKALATHNW